MLLLCLLLLLKTHQLLTDWVAWLVVGSFKNAQFSILLYSVIISESQNYRMLASIS